MVLKDGTQEIVITNVIYDVLVKQAGLDPLKEYTFDITKDESTTSYRIARIMDGKAVKYETPVLGHPTKQ